jgi:hypothetical protein
MKKIVCLIFAGIAIRACAQIEPPKHDWNVTLKVVDETGQPVEAAKTWVCYLLTNQIAGLTDTNGVFVASHHDGSENLAFQIKKLKYYSCWIEYHMGRNYKPERWNPTQTIVLRKIGNPISMYAKRHEMKFPKLDEPVGFDLMIGDWVTPYGKGAYTDIFYTAHRKIITDREFTADLIVTFPNKGDGIVVAPSESAAGSEFKTSRTAAENGYGTELVLHYSNTQRPEQVFGYFIRVRTILDESGNIKSALYGKIRGDFRFYAGTIAPTAGMGFDYYLNPTPNSRNVEFDPKRNLMKNLKPGEEVSAP